MKAANCKPSSRLNDEHTVCLHVSRSFFNLVSNLACALVAVVNLLPSIAIRIKAQDLIWRIE